MENLDYSSLFYFYTNLVEFFQLNFNYNHCNRKHINLESSSIIPFLLLI